MPKSRFIIFFSIVLSLYAIINYYIFIRGWEAISAIAPLRAVYVAVFLILSISFIAGRILERRFISWFTTLLVWIGAVWLGTMVYFLFAVIVLDAFRIANLIIHFFPAFLTADYESIKQITAVFVVCIVGIVVFAGFLNARAPRIRTLDIAIPKFNPGRKTFTIAMASDIHLGTIISTKRLNRIITKINALNPDIVLLPGDVFDEDIGPVIRKNLGDHLRQIQSRFGVFAITGNHEYIGGVDAACDYMEKHGVRVLRDEIITIDKSIHLIGREDRSIAGFSGKSRKSLEELIAGITDNPTSKIDKNNPIILMDHQPFHLEEAVQNGVDLQLSGHTHHGQLWPFNFITKRVYELSWGYKKKENTHFYVSCGVGTWGPPIRTGNRPEIIHIQLTFA